MHKLLLLSNSTLYGTPFFSWPKPYVKEFLSGSGNLKILFVPYAAVTLSFDDYFERVNQVFAEIGFAVESIHQQADRRVAVEQAEVLLVGGGNTFALVSRLYEDNLVHLMSEKVRWGTPYIGWSAGANIACPTMMTTNDMPVAYPPSFNTLDLVPFQLNPHYTEFKQEGHGGETRPERLQEFLVMNKERRVLGLPEGMLVEREENNFRLRGKGTARWFAFGNDPKGLTEESDFNAVITES